MIEATKELILTILDLIGYSEDKEEFTEEFIKNVQLQSLLNLISSLPVEQQEELQNRLDAIAKDVDYAANVLEDYFTKEQLTNSFENAAKAAITAYLEAIAPSLSESQKENLTTTFQDLKEQTTN